MSTENPQSLREILHRRKWICQRRAVPGVVPGEPAMNHIFGLPPRISILSSPNLDLSSPNLSCSSSVLLANSYDSRKAAP